MMQKTTGIITLALGVALGAAPAARAAAPGLFTTAAGTASKWDNSKPIHFSYDQGSLGKMSNAKATRMFEDALDQWRKIDTASITLEEGDPLDRDVTGDNLGEFIQGLPSDVNPIIFDSDGSAIDALLGSGASESILAFGGSFSRWVTPAGAITQGLILLNGRVTDGQFDPDDLSQSDMTRVATRAIGQMLNIGTSDLNEELLFDGNVANNSAVPVMYPGRVLGGGFILTLDDRIAASMLYPSPALEKNTGVIRGQVVLADGTTGLQGIDVIARKVDDPFNTAVSAISGALFRNSSRRGSRDPKLRGAFELHVPPGSYTIEYRAVRAAVGPLGGAVPLPGGAQFYAGVPTAGPVDPAQATPVTVTAGQSTEVKLVAGGAAAPAPQNITVTDPNFAPGQAPLLPANAVVTAKVSPKDPGQVVLDLGGGVQDRVENLYRVDVTEPSIKTLLQTPGSAADLDLYLIGASQIGGAGLNGISSRTRDNGGEALQLLVNPGTVFLGVSAQDAATSTDPVAYTLAVTLTPQAQPTAKPRPVLNQLVVGNVTATSAEAHWLTDLDATADAVVGLPLQQFGDATVGKTHAVPLSGLTAGAYTDLSVLSQVAGGQRDNLPRVFFRTASATAATGAAKLKAGVIGVVPDADSVENSVDVAVAIQNTGGDAASVQVTGLTASAGWKLAVPVSSPISVGGIGSGATALVVVRLIRDGTGPDPIPTVTGTGTLAGAGGTAENFAITAP